MRQPTFQEAFVTRDSVKEFPLVATTGILDSTLVSQSSDITMIKNWIIAEGSGSVRFKLLYRGTRDGFKPDDFQKRCAHIKPTLTLMKSEYGKVFGGYVEDQDWTNTNSYKNTTKAFIFSVTNQKKYLQKQDCSSTAIYTHSNYLTTFGGGFDIHCSDHSYSRFPHTYEGGKDSNQSLVGGYMFKLDEIEVFQVERFEA
jgi:hypothetical protein